MMRQIAGSFAEYEKARLVAKLRGARERKRAESGKCEGRKSWAEINPDLVRRSYQAPNMALASNPNTHIAVVLAPRGGTPIPPKALVVVDVAELAQANAGYEVT